jgi:RNA polymerase sigma-70 factor (ECF subfamily)
VIRDEILQRLRERVKAFAASHYGREAAEDIAQDVMLVLHERYSHVDGLADLLPLAMKVARLRMMSMRRKSIRRGEPGQVSVDDEFIADLSPDAEEQLERQQLAERLAAALAELGDRCREVFRMKLAGLSFPEIQKQLGVSSINTIYTWEARCRKQLMALVGRDWSSRKPQ